MAKPTINDVARIAGVSKKTVSRVINRSPMLSDATRAKVEAVVAELGYVPDPQARALALGHSLLVALIHDGSDPALFGQAHDGVLDAIEGTDHALVVSRLNGGGTDALAGFLARHRPAAAILLPQAEENVAIPATCHNAGVRTLRLGPCSFEDEVRTFAADERTAMAQAVQYLIDLGHRRIAFISGPDASQGSRARELGYLDAMADHGLDRGPALIESGDFSLASGRAAAEMLLRISPRPTAIVAANDIMAAGALQAALGQGIAVPQALSIAGFGDSALAGQVWPPLASVHVPWRDMARKATALALGMEIPSELDFPTELRMRGTVAPPA